MITVETCGEKKYTAAKEEVACGSAATAHWREHLFFEPRNVVSIYIRRVGRFKTFFLNLTFLNDV